MSDGNNSLNEDITNTTNNEFKDKVRKTETLTKNNENNNSDIAGPYLFLLTW